MQFYCEPSNKCEYNATPFRIDVGGLRLSSKSKDAFPFVLDSSGNVAFGSRHSEHHELKGKYDGEAVMDGRYWLNSGAISFWGVYNKPLYEVQKNVEKVLNAISSKTGTPLSKIHLFFECNRHDVQFAVEISVDEFLSIKPSTETIDDVLFNLMVEKGCNKDGVTYRDLFRHYNITEKINKNMKKNVVKLNENSLRRIVSESVKNILSEIDMGDGYNSLPGEGAEDDRTSFEKCRDELDRACQYAYMAEDAYKKKNIEEFHNRFQQVWSCCCNAFEALGYDKPNW